MVPYIRKHIIKLATKMERAIGFIATRFPAETGTGGGAVLQCSLLQQYVQVVVRSIPKRDVESEHEEFPLPIPWHWPASAQPLLQTGVPREYPNIATAAYVPDVKHSSVALQTGRSKTLVHDVLELSQSDATKQTVPELSTIPVVGIGPVPTVVPVAFMVPFASMVSFAGGMVVAASPAASV